METLKNVKTGIIVYTSFFLTKKNKLSIQKLKQSPKEAFVKWEDIQTISTFGVDNWVKIETQHGEFYEDKSICNFIRIIEENSNLIFQKITNSVCVCVNRLKYKSNLSIVELVSGQVYEVSRSYKSRLKESILKVWHD